MIVIATHNGIACLPRLIASLQLYGYSEDDVLIVDTGTTCDLSKQYLATLDCCVIKSEPNTYDTGAWLAAYRQTDAESYLFLHDSTYLTIPGIEGVCEARWGEKTGAVALARFPMFFDNDAQMDWLAGAFPMDKVLPYHSGIFGSMFYTRRDVLDTLSRQGFLDNCIPKNKQESQSMERGWAIALHSCGYEVEYLCENYHAVNESNIGVQKVYQHRL